MYEIITVDWNPEQTRIWRHHVQKKCPGAKIITVPDTKLIHWCWSGGKLACFNYGFKTDRIIYMDTDTIVTHDLEGVFDMMGDSVIAMSSGIEMRSAMKYKQGHIDRIGESITYHWPPVHFSSGMMVLNGYRPEDLYENWKACMEDNLFKREFRKYRLAEEMALAVVMSASMTDPDMVYHLPYEVHGNLLGGQKIFGTAEIPWVIHYHQPDRLEKAGFKEYLEV